VAACQPFIFKALALIFGARKTQNARKFSFPGVFYFQDSL
jgi:hypothetical protein